MVSLQVLSNTHLFEAHVLLEEHGEHSIGALLREVLHEEDAVGGDGRLCYKSARGCYASVTVSQPRRVGKKAMVVSRAAKIR
jgi:hypothetical protein